MLLVAWFVCCNAASAQTIQAIAGEPFGVGRLTLPIDPERLPVVLGAQGVSLSTPDGRILYPVVEAPADHRLVKELLFNSPLLRGGPVREQAGGLLSQLLNRPAPTNIYFLFRGNEPLRVRLGTRTARELVVRPIAAPYAHGPLLSAWWRAYTAKPQGLLAPKADYPPVVSNYLQAMLARRLGLILPESEEEKSWQDQFEGQLGLFLGTEDVRLAIVRDRMLGRTSDAGGAMLPLPNPPAWPPLKLPEPAKDAKIKIEPIANRVPAECLYVRFGSFANFFWLQDTLKTWGGDLSNLVALRGLDVGQSRKMEELLVVKQTALGRMLGPTVISDVAIIGTDMFMREGAAFGILFEARNSFLLENDFKRQRAERVKLSNVTEKTVKIADRDVSFLSSPDGLVRSYYLADKGYLFVTTSEALMRRFIETRKDGDSLGRSAEFRHARSVMPLARDDTVFVYLSDAFFQNMAGPRYWIELSRRLQAVADIQMVEMAALASAAEGKPGDTIGQLVEGHFLPPGFGPRADGSQTILVDGETIDSRRGRRGFFVPIPDTPVEQIAPSELAAYQNFLNVYHEKWGRLDPMLVGIKRHAAKNHVERVVLDIRANPFARRHFERLSEWIGPADKQRLAPIPGDLAAFEAQLVNQRLFGGLRDTGPPFQIVNGRFTPTGGLLNMIVGYLGTTGRLGFLGLLDRRIGAPDNTPGLAGRDGLMWRHRDERFTVFSLQRDVLAQVCPRLRFVPAERPAQIRLHVGDVSRSRFTPAILAMSYLRTRDTSLGNLRLMHAMNQQLHVPGTDCRAAAELLLDARLICPLGGEYEYLEQSGDLGYWTSNVLAANPGGSFLDVRVPQGYQAPPLNWFRGLEAEVTMTAKDLSAHVEILMRMPDKPILPEPELEAVPLPKAEPTQVQKKAKKKSPGPLGGLLNGFLPTEKK